MTPVGDQQNPGPSPQAQGLDPTPAAMVPPAKGSLTAVRARQLLSYDPASGRLDRRRDSFRVGHKPKAERCLNKDGHPVVKLDGYTYIASRVIFLMQTGRWPHPFCIHRDNDQTNLRRSNLVEADARQLTHNRRCMKDAA